jgi:hypothetical protein
VYELLDSKSCPKARTRALQLTSPSFRKVCPHIVVFGKKPGVTPFIFIAWLYVREDVVISRRVDYDLFGCFLRLFRHLVGTRQNSHGGATRARRRIGSAFGEV